MCKKRLHVVTPGCPCATVGPILPVFTRMHMIFAFRNAAIRREEQP